MVLLQLTRAEALALSHAIGNSLYSEEDAKAIFVSPPSREAAYRGQEKLRAAIRNPGAAGRCPVHPHVTLRCPGCAGAKGGSVRSPKKRRAVRRNLQRANAVQFTPSEVADLKETK